MSVQFPIQIRRPFDVSTRRSPNIPAFNVAALDFPFPRWPAAGSALESPAQPSTLIPIDTDAIAAITFGSAPMLVTHNGHEAQYRLATCVATLQIERVSRKLHPSEFLFLNLQMTGTLQGGDTVLANSYPDMVRPYIRESDGSTNLANHRIVFPTLTAPVGTVLNTVSMRLLMFMGTVPEDLPDPYIPFWFEYSITGAAAVADPIQGPIVGLHV